MSELINFETNVKMTSLDIAEITGKRHDHVMRDIRKEIDNLGKINAPIFGLVDYIDAKGEKRPCYTFGKKGAMQLALKYDAVTRYKVIEKIEELENKSKFKIPQTYSQALKLAAEQAEQIEEQQKLIEVQKPKAEFFDTVTGSKDTIDMATVAKVLNKGIGRNKLFELLRDNNILDKRNQPYQTFIDRGYFRQVESSYIKPDGTNCIHVKTVVYQKGLNFISKLIDKSKNGN
jgi:phage antirepressor YoqD-like protein